VNPPTLTVPATADEAGLDYQRCRWCGTPSYRRLLCPTCASPDLADARSEGIGIVTRPPQSSQSEAVVQLLEGFTVQGRVIGALNGAVHPGAAVRLCLHPEEMAFRLCPVGEGPRG
jgi:uncharacterized protein